MKYYIEVLKKYAVFSGRARRKEYWMFFLFNVIFGFAASILDQIINREFGIAALYQGHYFSTQGYIGALYSLATFVPSLAAVSRRFHDIGKSIWLAWVGMGPFILAFILILIGADIVGTFFIIVGFLSFIWMIVLLATNGQPHANKYGPDPKRGTEFEFDFMKDQTEQ